MWTEYLIQFWEEDGSIDVNNIGVEYESIDSSFRDGHVSEGE